MADIRESFATLENVATQEGAVLGARTEGQAAAGIQGSIGFAFKDSSGNVVMPQLSPAGEIYVSTEKPGDNLHARGENAGSATVVTIATITLTASKSYQGIEAIVSCFRDAIFQIIQINDAVETVLADALVGPGHYSQEIDLERIEFTAGATGTQELVVRANNINALSSMRASLATKELA